MSQEPVSMPQVPRRDRFTSPGMAALRFIAQRGILKQVVWRNTRVTVVTDPAAKKLTGGFVVVANHSSHLDAPLIMCSLPRNASRYLAAGAAADYFFDVWWRRGLTALFFNAFPIDRTGVRRESGGVSKGLIRRGVPLLIFPEGTRSKTGAINAFTNGAAGLAISCDVPVLPVTLVGASDAMPRGRNWIIPGRPPITVVIGAPLSAAPGENAEGLTRRLSETIRSTHEKTKIEMFGARDDDAPPAERGIA